MKAALQTILADFQAGKALRGELDERRGSSCRPKEEDI
jgi:hypothetical protein